MGQGNEELRYFHLSNRDEQLVSKYIEKIPERITRGVLSSAAHLLQVSRKQDLDGYAQTITAGESGPTTGKFVVGVDLRLRSRHSSGSE
jgi:hypothetical protein